MARAEGIYHEKDKVDDFLLNQIGKFVRFENLSKLSSDLGISEVNYEGITAEPSTEERTFQVLQRWSKQKFDFRVQELLPDLMCWQTKGYLNKAIWDSKIFSFSLIPQAIHIFNTYHSTSGISDKERKTFEDQDLDPVRWVPKLCRYFKISKLELLKEVRKDEITQFLAGIKNMIIKAALRNLLNELRCLYVPTFALENLISLPDILDRRRKYLTMNRDEGDQTKFKDLIDQLECTVWRWHRSPNQSYEFLTCLATLSLFDFSLEDLSFKHILSEKEIGILSSMLNLNFEELKRIKDIQHKQAFVLSIALNNPFDKIQVVQYILENLPDKCCDHFTDCSLYELDFTEVQKKVHRTLQRKDDQKVLEEKKNSLSMFFNAIFSRKPPESEQKKEKIEAKDTVKKILDELGLIEYYPQKITFEDVIKVTEDDLKGVHEKPSTLRELPWYFMRRLIGLNSEIRETCFSIADEFNKSINSNKALDHSSDDYYKNRIHPLDLIYIIFLCADDFLRQELADKMYKCQYAVPFILPYANKNADESQNLVLYWGLQAISGAYCDEDNQIMAKTLAKIECPIISCLTFEDYSPWKLKLLNKLSSSVQDPFWDKDLGRTCSSKVSQGMVEVFCYLPSGENDDQFKTSVIFANLRGNVHQHPLATQRLIKSSTTTCIFADKINKEVFDFLHESIERKYLKKIILVTLCNPMREKNRNIEQLKTKLDLEDHQVICDSMQDDTVDTFCYVLKRSIQSSIDLNIVKKKSLHKFTSEVKLSGCMNVDDAACRLGQEAAHTILSAIDAIKSSDVKSKILPRESDVATRKDISKLEKEVCRQKNIAGSHLTTQLISRAEEEKWQLQWKLLQHPISDPFAHFLWYLTSFNANDRRYFLQSLKQGLKERSIKLFYEEYGKYRHSDRSDAVERKLNQQLTYSSLGLEHFFREIAVMFENMAALIVKLDSKEDQLEAVLNTLSKTMAGVLLEGKEMEFFDGDVDHCPVNWLNSVLNQMKNLRIFTVSTIGVQSSGKSTLLNTVFGLDFPLNNLRCTRGAYMQLVKIDENLAKSLQRDYLMLMNTEGLMSTVPENKEYDNELVTFVMGMSDLTLAVIKDKEKAIEDVLPITIRVYPQMNVGKPQASHLVHKSMGFVDVGKTLLSQQLLSIQTSMAAAEAGHGKYEKFSDALHYDSKIGNVYGLWDGTWPVGKVDVEYSQKMQRLKTKILERIVCIAERRESSTIEDFSKYLQRTWEAIKYENFVFSFRNVLAMETYKQLWKILSDEQWEIKRKMRQDIDIAKRRIKDEALTEIESGKYVLEIHKMKEKCEQTVASCIRSLSETIVHYFECLGCSECSSEVRNRHFLGDYKDEFEHNIESFRVTLIEEVNHSAKNLRAELEADMTRIQLSSRLRDSIKNEVQNVIAQTKTQMLSEEKTKKSFDDIWTSIVDEFMEKINGKEINVKMSIQNIVTSLLGPEVCVYLQRKSNSSNRIDEKHFDVQKSHLRGGSLKLLKERTQAIIEKVSSHCGILTEGKQYEAEDAKTLFDDILTSVKQLNQEGLDTSLDYKMDLIIYMEELAVRNFTSNQNIYKEKSSISAALLHNSKESYYHLFLMTLEEQLRGKRVESTSEECRQK